MMITEVRLQSHQNGIRCTFYQAYKHPIRPSPPVLGSVESQRNSTFRVVVAFMVHSHLVRFTTRLRLRLPLDSRIGCTAIFAIY